MKRVLRTSHVCVPPRFVLALLATLLFAVQCFTQTRSASSTPQNERGVLLEDCYSISYCQNRAMCTAHHFVSNVPRRVRSNLTMRGAP